MYLSSTVYNFNFFIMHLNKAIGLPRKQQPYAVKVLHLSVGAHLKLKSSTYWQELSSIGNFIPIIKHYMRKTKLLSVLFPTLF